MHGPGEELDLTEVHRDLAVAAHREAWRLLELPQRSVADDAALLTAAHVSLHHWNLAGTGVHFQRAAWLVARAYVAVGAAGPASLYAHETLRLTATYRGSLQDFDLAFAEEIAARAEALAGRTEIAGAHHGEARRLGKAIAEPEDREEFFCQFAAGPWFGLAVAGSH